MTRVPVLCCALLVVVALVGCGGLSSEQRAALDGAVAALNRIDAGTEVGVGYSDYRMLLIDAKTEVKSALAVLPESELASELGQAMDAYADAGTAWAKRFADSEWLFENTSPGDYLIPRYSLPTEQSPYFGDRLGRRIDPESAVQHIWLSAEAHLERVKELRS